MRNYMYAFLGATFLSVIGFLALSTSSGFAATSYSTALRRYPYLTDVVSSYATVNWATDRSDTAGGVSYGKVGAEACTAHYVPATKVAISVNGVAEYQWKAQLSLLPNTQYCYRVFLGTSPSNQVDLLGSDAAPSFWTQTPMGANQSFSFLVIGDWGMVDSTGTNSYQAQLMSLMASSGARFVVTTGDNGYPDGNQKNLGDLIQTGLNISAVFGSSFWKVPGASLPIFPIIGNHGYYSPDTNHPHLLTWPEDRAVSLSGGRYKKETYCCLDGTTSKSYPSTWYAFDAGPARFYMLNAAWDEVNIGTASEYKVDYDYHWASGTAQLAWLKADLAAHPSVVKFAFFHYPLYTDNPNEATDTYLLGSSGLEGLLKQNGVDLAFTGHAHIYERNLASASGIPNYVTGGGGAVIGTLGTCTSLDAYAIKFTTTGKACGSAPTPTSAGQVFHFLKVTVNGTSINVTPINALGNSFDVQNYSFTSGVETTPPSTPTNLAATASGGTQVNLTWSASSDNTGVRGYSIYRNGSLIATVDKNTLKYPDSGLSIATSYSYQVDAFDGSGNHSALSSAVSATTAGTATYTFNPIADAYVYSGATGTNYGTSTVLRADASPDYHSYLRFNVGDISGTVTKATLKLYTTSSSSVGYTVKRELNQSWEEGKITYANAPAPGATLGTSGSITSGTWVSVDVTSFVNTSGVFDLVLTTTSTAALNFNSRDASSNQPQLVIQTSTSASLPTPTPTATVSGGTTLTFTATADARVAQAYPTTNYGTQTNLQATAASGAAQTSFLRFTTSGITGTVQSVKLRVYCTTNGTTNGPASYLADSNWTESGTGGVTWNTQPALLSGATDNKGSIAASSWVEYDVTSLVSGNGTFTFALVADGTDGVTFSSREGTNPPQLVVTFSSGAAAAALLPADASAITPTPTPLATDMPAPTNTPLPDTPTSAPTETPTLAAVQDTATPTAAVAATSSRVFTAEADARVSQTSPATNYGSATTLMASGESGAAQTSFLRFTVSGLTGAIQNVKLRVYCSTNGTTNGPAVYLADSNWVESGAGGVTWKTQPALSSDLVDNKDAIAADSWVEYDVTSLVSGDGTYTFALVGDSNDGVTFSSREGSAAPQLVVTFGP